MRGGVVICGGESRGESGGLGRYAPLPVKFCKVFIGKGLGADFQFAESFLRRHRWGVARGELFPGMILVKYGLLVSVEMVWVESVCCVCIVERMRQVMDGGKNKMSWCGMEDG